ncbi:hypothetical protein [Noviherbaspirillum soli]|uniref:hypothetical protein n=1 Tax=Noviherbaspirillum soli TaxID=1064518 RepID=UPI00188D7F64|nr:hypothetical protein [Noviherbaspirillum soli]
MASKIGFATLVLAALAGCGGGSASVSVDGPEPSRRTFIFWSGSSSGERVVDVNNDAFAFFSDTGCLYNFQTGRENQGFCLNAGGDRVRYGVLAMRIVNVTSAAGTCIAALVEESTAQFVDIATDAFDREVVAVTALRPSPCF